MWITEDNCVACADGCRHCGRDHQQVRVCDGCGDHLYDLFFNYDNQDLCPDCALTVFAEELGENIEDDNMSVLDMAEALDAFVYRE